MKRGLLGLLAAGALLGVLAGGAAARSFSLSNQTWRAQYRELRFTLPEGTVNCQVTLEGSFHARALVKSAGSLIGYITRATLGPCSVGRATLLTATLPWHVRYQSFQGTLPNIVSLAPNLIGFALRVANGFFNCLAVTTASEPMVGELARNTSTGAIETTQVGGTARTGPECFGVQGTFSSSTSIIGVLNAIATRITVTLI